MLVEDLEKIEEQKKTLEGLDLQAILVNKERNGSLVFDDILDLAEKTKKILLEFFALNFEKYLIDSDIQHVLSSTKSFIDKVLKLRDFDVATGFDKNQRDSLAHNTKHSFQEIINNLLQQLVFLRQENPKDLNKFDEEMKEVQEKMLSGYASFLEKMKEEVSKQMQARLAEVDIEKSKIENTKGEIAAITFGKHFEVQAGEYKKSAKNFLTKKYILEIILALFITANIVFYFLLKLDFFLKLEDVDTIFSIEYLVLKISLIALLSYSIGFNSKNYSINRDLQISNNHRKNVAETMKSFFATNPEKDVRSQIISRGVEAMFRSENLGYLGKINQKDHSPMEQVNYILPQGIEGLLVKKGKE